MMLWKGYISRKEAIKQIQAELGLQGKQLLQFILTEFGQAEYIAKDTVLRTIKRNK